MNVKRVDFGAVLVDNKIYAVGGTSSFSRDQIEVLDMDHLVDGWQTINVQLPAEYRLCFCYAAAINSTIYIKEQGGDRILTFDTISQTFSEVFPACPLYVDTCLPLANLS